MASTAQPAPSSTLAAALANSRLAELPGPQRAAALLLLLGYSAGALRSPS